jgi:SAM-dependent methyltransferase
MDVHSLAFANLTFDTIICFETLEHLDSPYNVLREFKRVLKADGKIWISIPNVWYWRRIIRTKPKKFTSDPSPEEYHKQGWDIHEIYSLAHSVGLEVTGGVWLNWYGQKRRLGFLDHFFKALPQIAYEHAIYKLTKLGCCT